MPGLDEKQVLEKKSFPGHVLSSEQMEKHAKSLQNQVVVVVRRLISVWGGAIQSSADNDVGL